MFYEQNGAREHTNCFNMGDFAVKYRRDKVEAISIYNYHKLGVTFVKYL